MSNIHGLGSSYDKKKDNDDKKKKNEEFSQGGKTSSTAVYRPTGKGDDTNADIIRQARAAGAAGGEAPQGEPTAKITLYSNGYIVDGGDFQDTESSPVAKMNLMEMKAGNLPHDMEAQVKAKMNGRPGNPTVAISDKTSERYEPPPEVFSFDKSKGNSMGGGASVTDLSSLAPLEFKLDENEPKTTIQVIAADRKKHRVKVNTSATVAQLYQHVMSLTNKSSFSLVGGFPPKALSDYNATIKDAGLAGASVTQRL